MKRSPELRTRIPAAFAIALLVGTGNACAYTATPLGAALTPDAMAQSLVSPGSGIVINSASYRGANGASGVFTGGNAIFGIDSGLVLTSGSARDFGDVENGVAGEPLLKPLTTGATGDASVLIIRFTPQGDQIQFSYVFASREYPEFVDSEFNDVFGFFVNGSNRALIPGSSQPVAINNINCGNTTGAGAQPFCNLFIDNRDGSRGLPAEALGGWTRVFNLTAPVNPGVENELMLAIADVADNQLDSAALIASGSFSICGGEGQPSCETGGGEPGIAVALPLASPAQAGLMGALLAAVAAWRLRRRSV